jgi:hypothetical protein
MSEEAAVLQMIRLLPMVEALHEETLRLANMGGGHAPDYFVARLNAHVERVAELTADEFLRGLTLGPEAVATNEQKMEQVTGAASELQAYLRQRIGITMGGKGGNTFGLAPHYTGCHFAAGVPEERPEEE